LPIRCVAQSMIGPVMEFTRVGYPNARENA
jgi:hypothetical protein